MLKILEIFSEPTPLIFAKYFPLDYSDFTYILPIS